MGDLMSLDVCGGSSLRALHNVAQDTMAMTMKMFRMNQAVFDVVFVLQNDLKLAAMLQNNGQLF